MDINPKILKEKRKKRRSKVGLPPGSLIHTGDSTTEKTKISVYSFDENACLHQEDTEVITCAHAVDGGTNVWIEVDGLAEVSKIEALGEALKIHPLVLEDILHTEQRPKLQEFDDYAFLVMRRMEYTSGLTIQQEQLSIILSEKYIVTFTESEEGFFKPVRDRLIHGKTKMRKMGADFLAYNIMDLVVDFYFTVLEDVGERIEDIEARLLDDPSTDLMKQIYGLKRKLVALRKSVWPLREMISMIERGESEYFTDGVQLYMRDVYDHTIQVLETVETYRDMISGMLDVYLSSISNRMNGVIKTLTTVSTIFIPLTFISGVYGMNFKNIPELQWEWGYPFSLGIMGATAIGLLIYFWRKKWF